MEEFRIEHTDGKDGRFIELCRLLDDFLTDMIGKDKQHTVYAQYNSLDDIHDVILIFVGDSAVACGSFKRYDDSTMELKRIFVKEEYRKNGFGHIIVGSLEKKALEKGASRLILETGVTMTAANNLYASCGFKTMPNYGEYEGIESSVCMFKNV